VESLAGKLLISSPSLVDPNFRRTVVLMTHHDDEGAVGLVLSRPSELRIADAVPDLGELPYADEVVYVLVELDELREDTEPIVGRVAYMPPGIETWDLAASRARVFAGYSGWGPGQLEAELEEPAWIVAPAEPEDVFAPDPDELWRTVLQRKGGMYALIATMPYDPSRN